MNLPERWRAPTRVTDGGGEPAGLEHERDRKLEDTRPRNSLAEGDVAQPPGEAGGVVASPIATRGTRAGAERVRYAERETADLAIATRGTRAGAEHRSPDGIDGTRAVALDHERVLRALRMTRARRLAIALGSSGQLARAR